jgi:hypothetical protein
LTEPRALKDIVKKRNMQEMCGILNNPEFLKPTKIPHGRFIEME